MDYLPDDLKRKLKSININLDMFTGQLSYAKHFKPTRLNFELVFIRHGETFGNAGQTTNIGTIDHHAVKNAIRDRNKRIFQGDVDDDINQLTNKGQIEAQYVAQKLKKELLDKGFQPDVIFTSHLKRAKDTAKIFVENEKLQKIYQVHPNLYELSFGAFDNRRICDIDSNHICHQFYLNQNALVKLHGINGNGQYQTGENFCELLIRANQVLQEFNQHYNGKKMIIFSHSMFGAALKILLGSGPFLDNTKTLAFDGCKPDGTPYTLPHATPIVMRG